MDRKLFLIVAMLAAGCTTAPQADVMDFAFPSRNACAPPQPAPVVLSDGSVVMQPQQAVEQQPQGCCVGCKGKLKDCALCRPFQIFRRNRPE